MSLNVKCPRCGRYWYARKGESEVECNCDLYCSEGSQPSDCSMTDVTWTGASGYPRGMHISADSELDADRPQHRMYCATHERYSDKEKILIPVDWSRLNQRAKPAFRDFGEDTF